MTIYVFAILLLFVLITLAKAIRDRAAEASQDHRTPRQIPSDRRRRPQHDSPFLDSVRDTLDLREQITKIEPQPVITRDNVTMEVDAVIYSVIVDPVRATYEVQNLRWGLEQLTLSALRNVIGQLDLDHTLASRDTTNSQLRAALDTATQQWGVKVMRIELKNITPPEEIRLTMEKQMTAERTRRAVVTTAEGEKASAILRAEGQKQSQIVTAEGSRAGGDPGGRRSSRGPVARRERRSAGDSDGRAGDRHGWKSGAVSDRAAISRIAVVDRDQRQQACIPALRGVRNHGVARRHQRVAEGRSRSEVATCAAEASRLTAEVPSQIVAVPRVMPYVRYLVRLPLGSWEVWRESSRSLRCRHRNRRVVGCGTVAVGWLRNRLRRGQADHRRRKRADRQRCLRGAKRAYHRDRPPRRDHRSCRSLAR